MCCSFMHSRKRGFIAISRSVMNEIVNVLWRYCCGVAAGNLHRALQSQVWAANTIHVLRPKAWFILRTQIYAVCLYADHFPHVGRVFSATNADLRRSDRTDAEYKHSYNTPNFTLTFARLLKLC